SVQEIERRMLIQERWTSEGNDWKDAAELTSNRRYRRAVDNLEFLVLKRLFELTKMNKSGLGKLRRHIAKALQVRSKAIRAALARYNSAAAALQPPQISMSWADVIDYAFLAHFDILRDPEGSAALRAWSDPLARALMDGHFKIQRAKEEIKRLNIEIRRFVTYM
ncbi:hypothetical protein GGX14DRAFT_305903, partial [Mycena pura]